MGKISKDLGNIGENEAENFLTGLGYRTIDRNFHSYQGEIDIIALDGETLVFVEVKNYSFKSLATPYSAISKGKKGNIIHAAKCYLQKYKITDRFCRFDVVIMQTDKMGEKKVELIKDAFRLS